MHRQLAAGGTNVSAPQSGWPDWCASSPHLSKLLPKSVNTSEAMDGGGTSIFDFRFCVRRGAQQNNDPPMEGWGAER
jgi:hypothetical protein